MYLLCLEILNIYASNDKSLSLYIYISKIFLFAYVLLGYFSHLTLLEEDYFCFIVSGFWVIVNHELDFFWAPFKIIPNNTNFLKLVPSYVLVNGMANLLSKSKTWVFLSFYFLHLIVTKHGKQSFKKLMKMFVVLWHFRRKYILILGRKIQISLMGLKISPVIWDNHCQSSWRMSFKTL